jgi:hypothetical protein
MTQRQYFMLATMATARAPLTPVQVQKLFFLIDRNISRAIGGPQFAFRPYNYGPFDRAVYDELEVLATTGHVELNHNVNWRTYRLSAQGQREGEAYLAKLGKPVQEYVSNAAEFVLRLSFTELVAAIYRAYPDMKENSVFQE